MTDEADNGAALFLVASPGFTATKWLANALSRHPDIYCEHATDSTVLDRDYTLGELDNLVRDKRTVRDEVPLDEYFRLLAARGDAAICGNVHRYHGKAILRNIKRWPVTTPFRWINLVRHPVAWVDSGVSQLAYQSQGVLLTRRQLNNHYTQHSRYYEQVERKWGVRFTHWESLAFLYLACRLQLLAQEATLDVRHVRMEEMTRDRTLFADIVSTLTDGRASVEPGWLEQVFEIGVVHRHHVGPNENARARFRNWERWQRDVFLYWAEVSDIRKAYTDFGYDFSFLDD